MDYENDQLYSVGADRALKVWNIREQSYMETHYGHVGDCTQVAPYSRDRVVSIGMDQRAIFYKIFEES